MIVAAVIAAYLAVGVLSVLWFLHVAEPENRRPPWPILLLGVLAWPVNASALLSDLWNPFH